MAFHGSGFQTCGARGYSLLCLGGAAFIKNYILKTASVSNFVCI